MMGRDPLGQRLAACCQGESLFCSSERSLHASDSRDAGLFGCFVKERCRLAGPCCFVSLRCFSHRSQPCPKTSKLNTLFVRRVKIVHASNDMHVPLLDHPDPLVDS